MVVKSPLAYKLENRRMTDPALPTIKKLFAYSGDRCAFAGCESLYSMRLQARAFPMAM